MEKQGQEFKEITLNDKKRGILIEIFVKTIEPRKIQLDTLNLWVNRAFLLKKMPQDLVVDKGLESKTTTLEDAQNEFRKASDPAGAKFVIPKLIQYIYKIEDWKNVAQILLQSRYSLNGSAFSLMIRRLAEII